MEQKNKHDSGQWKGRVWKPMSEAPWQTPIWVVNDLMERPVKATRGYAAESGVCSNLEYCTMAFTQYANGEWTEGGYRLVVPDRWTECLEGE